MLYKFHAFDAPFLNLPSLGTLKAKYSKAKDVKELNVKIQKIYLNFLIS